MIRFLIDQFRNAPGPLKKPRILVADLAEEVLDLAKHYLGKSDDGNKCCASESHVQTTPTPAPAPTPSTSSQQELITEPVTQTVAEQKAEVQEQAIDTDEKLLNAIKAPGNARKQAFKVLAILWDAHSKKMGALSAKAISKHGESLSLQIRHENVRKVIRMRLEKYVNVHAQGVGNGTVYNYELSKAGVDYFMDTYL